MFRPVLLLTLVLSLISFSNLHACDIDGITGIIEENDLWIGPDVEGPETITKEQFNKIIDDVSAIYAPVIQEKGKKLVVERKWDDGTVNAYARQVGKSWMVSMFGGLARHEAITPDGFALVVCHEIGHHIGGAPKKRGFFFSSWASNEGQADYWGNLKCMRKYLEGQDNIAVVNQMEIDAHATETCKSQFTLAEDIAICQRSSMAGLSLAKLFKALRNQTLKLSFETPDSTRVSKTNDNHPATQCRLDTYFAGAVCMINHNEPVSTRNPDKGTCNRQSNHEVGVRPLCWYKP